MAHMLELQEEAADCADFDAPPHETTLWRRLRASGDEPARRSLIALHMPYARVVAACYYSKRFHDEIEFDEYLQFARVGLLEAMERYECDRGAQFRTFAARRMHGAILSGIERITEKQQQIAARQRFEADRLASLKDIALEGERAPQGTRQLFNYVAEVGLGLALAWLLEGTGMVDQPDRGETLPFYRNAAIAQLRQRLHSAVQALPPQERTVVRSHYLQQIPFDQVAVMMSLSKGRISQIHKQALLRLRGLVGEHRSIDLSF
ncbi:MAG TPA: sigma-70 family RNA polymerase sigma factor [Ramlibacter sp.]|nr:sigma-70 family RNA polymerase sigma factor [Ramlibacter sp.]